MNEKGLIKEKLRKNEETIIPEEHYEGIKRKIEEINKEYQKFLNKNVLKIRDTKLKALDYFGFLKVKDKILWVSNGDYLQEYSRKECFIKEKDAEYIKDKIGSKIKVLEKQLKDGSYYIETTSYVGVISLPSGFRIQIVPKISNVALFYILCYTYDIKDIDIYDETTFPKGAFFIDLLALIYKKELEKIIQQGLLKSYITQEENINYLRGKLLISEQIKRNLINKHKFYCVYDELTYDNLENQTILYALDILIDLVQNNKLKEELLGLKWILESEVTPRRSLTIEEVDQIKITRLNEYYEKILKLARYIIEETHITDLETKEVSGFSFLVDMNKLFEKFIFKVVKEIFTDYEVRKEKSSSILDGEPKVYIHPDIVVKKKGVPCLVIDTKYKLMDIEKEYGEDKSARAKPPDLYQIISYSLAYGCNGVLIYAGKDKDIELKYEFKELKKAISHLKKSI